jgi:hypothetical protein
MLVITLPENALTRCSAVSGASKPPLPQGWSGPDWPASLGRSAGGASHMGMGTSLGMGTSPFGRSVDMVDVVTQLMEAGGAWCLRLLTIKHKTHGRTRPAVPPLGSVSGLQS